jgi:hypothetical protein
MAPEGNHAGGSQSSEGAVMAIYEGHREGGVAVVTRDGSILPLLPSLSLRNRSPAGFEWGYGGSGPAQLALALLLDATDWVVALRHVQRFKRDVVSRWPESWSISAADIRRWVEEHDNTDDRLGLPDGDSGGC